MKTFKGLPWKELQIFKRPSVGKNKEGLQLSLEKTFKKSAVVSPSNGVQ